MQGIHNPLKICIRPRKEGLGYEGKPNNVGIKFVKDETLTGSSRNNKPRVESMPRNQVQ